MFQTSTTGLAPGPSLLGSALPPSLAPGWAAVAASSPLRTEGRLRKVTGELGRPWLGRWGLRESRPPHPHWKGDRCPVYFLSEAT